MSDTKANRILAVEIRAGRLGYAVFETPNRLLDFGGAWFVSSFQARSRIARLLQIFRPSVIVVGSATARGLRKTPDHRLVVRIVRSEGRKLSISVARVSRRALMAYFKSQSYRNKYDRAVLIATWFPEIAWKLPTRRKFYEPEARAMIYFDATALGAVYMRLAGENNRTDADGTLSPDLSVT